MVKQIDRYSASPARNTQPSRSQPTNQSNYSDRLDIAFPRHAPLPTTQHTLFLFVITSTVHSLFRLSLVELKIIMAAEASLLSEGDVATDLLLGIDPQEGSLVCKFNINVMPGKMSKAWCVVDVKRWKMMATCCGDLDGGCDSK